MFELAVNWINEVLEFGAKKHDGNTLEEGAGSTADEHLAKAVSHIRQHLMGNRYDLESGCPALAHAAARVVLALQTVLNEDIDHGPKV